MRREAFSQLVVFIAVAREGSFTRAAAKLGISQSSISHTVKELERQLGLRLLRRTTRSVSLTQAGERLMQVSAPRFDEIESEINTLGDLRDCPAGNIRITSVEHAAKSILLPKIAKVLQVHPAIKVEISIDGVLLDIVAQGYDAGVRLGQQVGKDMIAVRIGPDVRMVVVGSPDYFATRPRPRTPQDLTSHNCITRRLPTYGGLYPWSFAKNGQEMNMHPEGQIVLNRSPAIIQAAVEGVGLAHVPADMVTAEIKAGSLESVLTDWCPFFPGYHLYYPQNRQVSRAFSLVVDALRWRASARERHDEQEKVKLP